MRPVIGLDQSLTGTAWYAVPGGSAPDREGGFKTKPEAYRSRTARVIAIGERFGGELDTFEEPGWVFMEGYAMGASFQREFLGELGGELKRNAWTRGWNIVVVAPSTLKKFVLGKGVGPKDQMMMECYARWQYRSPNNDACDAFCLAQLGLMYLDRDGKRTVVEKAVCKTLDASKDTYIQHDWI